MAYIWIFVDNGRLVEWLGGGGDVPVVDAVIASEGADRYRAAAQELLREYLQPHMVHVLRDVRDRVEISGGGGLNDPTVDEVQGLMDTLLPRMVLFGWMQKFIAYKASRMVELTS